MAAVIIMVAAAGNEKSTCKDKLLYWRVVQSSHNIFRRGRMRRKIVRASPERGFAFAKLLRHVHINYKSRDTWQY